MSKFASLSYFNLTGVVQEVGVFHYKENPLIETNQRDIIIINLDTCLSIGSFI